MLHYLVFFSCMFLPILQHLLLFITERVPYMSFFKNIFSKDKKKPLRQLSSVNDLNKGDIIVLTDSFGLPENLRKQEFQISAINSYEYETFTQTEWVLTGSNNLEIFLSLEVEDTTYLKISLKISREDVESLFDLDQFSTLFESAEDNTDETDFTGQAFLERQSDTDLTNQWTSPEYQQSIYSKVGYFHRKDHRSENLSAYQGKDSGEQFELYQLLDKDEDKAVEVEVWQEGDTDVFLCLYRPLADIVDMYPGS
jgi:hypothetical protein